MEDEGSRTALVPLENHPEDVQTRRQTSNNTSNHHNRDSFIDFGKRRLSQISCHQTNNNDNYASNEVSQENSDNERTNLPYTRYQKWVLVCISMVCFSSYLLMAILAPFFPSEATKKGMSTTLSGLTFSVYALIIMLSSPVFGKLVPIVKPKPMLLVGVFVSGASNICFGLLDRVNDSSWFIASSLIIRSLEGLGAAAFSTASFTYIMHTFPTEVSAAFGLTETFIGIGETIGPAVGGGLYALGGYGLPFYVLGSFVIMTIPLCYFILEPIENPVIDEEVDEEVDESKFEDKDSTDDNNRSNQNLLSKRYASRNQVKVKDKEDDEQTCFEGSVQSTSSSFCSCKNGNHLSQSTSSCSSSNCSSRSESMVDVKQRNIENLKEKKSRSSRGGNTDITYWNLIQIPEILVVSLIVIIISNSQAFLEPTIEPHFELSLGKDANFVAIAFLAMAIAYAVMSPTTGWLAGGRISKFVLMMTGLIISSSGLLLLGPSQILSFIQPNVPTAIIAMILMGLSYALAFIPTFESMLDIALENGFADDVRTYSLISGLWGSMFSLGEVTGPVLGGLLVDSFNFKTASTIMSTLSTLSVITSIVTWVIRKRKKRQPHRDDNQYHRNLTTAVEQEAETVLTISNTMAIQSYGSISQVKKNGSTVTAEEEKTHL